MTNEPAATPVESDTKSRREVVPVPLTLQGFYAEKRVKAPAFVRAIEKGKVHGFSPEDEEVAMSLLDTADPFRERTVSLVTAAAKARRRSISELVYGWAFRVLRHDTTSLAVQDAFDDNGGRVAAETFVEVLSHAARQAAQDKDEAARRHAEARLRLARAWGATRAGIDPVGLARRAVIAVRSKPGIRGADGMKDRALRFVATADLKTIDQALGLLTLIEVTLEEARANEARANQEANRLREATHRLEAELSAARAEAARLSAALETVTATVSDLQRQLQDQRLGAQADRRATSGRIGRFLGERLLTLLEQAREATNMTPARADIAREFLMNLETEIAREIEWLNERSG